MVRREKGEGAGDERIGVVAREKRGGAGDERLDVVVAVVVVLVITGRR